MGKKKQYNMLDSWLICLNRKELPPQILEDISRLNEEARRRIRVNLTPEQKEACEKKIVEMLKAESPYSAIHDALFRSGLIRDQNNREYNFSSVIKMVNNAAKKHGLQRTPLHFKILALIKKEKNGKEIVSTLNITRRSYTQSLARLQAKKLIKKDDHM